MHIFKPRLASLFLLLVGVMLSAFGARADTFNTYLITFTGLDGVPAGNGYVSVDMNLCEGGGSGYCTYGNAIDNLYFAFTGINTGPMDQWAWGPAQGSAGFLFFPQDVNSIWGGVSGCTLGYNGSCPDEGGVASSYNTATDDYVYFNVNPTTDGYTAGDWELYIYGDPLGGTYTVSLYSSTGSGPGPTPEPSTLLLLGSGLLGFVPFVRHKFARA